MDQKPPLASKQPGQKSIKNQRVQPPGNKDLSELIDYANQQFKTKGVKTPKES